MSLWTSSNRPSMPSSEAHERQKLMAVLSGGLQNLAEVAQSPNAREGNDVGEIY